MGHRYWRLYVTASLLDWPVVGFSDITMAAAPGGVDLTTGREASVSALATGSGTAPSWGIDEYISTAAIGAINWLYDPVTGWYPEVPLFPWWWKIDFGTAQEVAEIAISMSYSDRNYAPKNFELQWSDDDAAWTTALTVIDEVRWGQVATDSSLQLVYLVGESVRLPLRVIAAPEGVSCLPVSLTIKAVSRAYCTLQVSAVTDGVLNGAAPVAGGAVDPAPASGYGAALAGAWRSLVVLDGVDVSGDVSGSVEVEAEEGAARIATFSLHLPPGQALALVGWVGKSVSIDVAALAGDGGAISPLRLFTGVVDTPEFDPASRLARLTCTDDLQGVCAAMSDAQIDQLVGGRWSPVVFDAAASHGWQRVQDRAATVLATIELDAWRSPRRSDWAVAAPHLSYDESTVEDDSLRVEFAPRSGLVNHVEIAFSYRFGLRCTRGYHAYYDLLADFASTGGHGAGVNNWVAAGAVTLARADVKSAISSVGASVESVDYVPLPAEGYYGEIYLTIKPQQFALECMGFSAMLAFSYAQTVEEKHAIVVEAPASVTRCGQQISRLSSALEAVAQDGGEWESRSWSSATAGNLALRPVEVLPVIAGVTTRQAAVATADTDRATAEQAMATLIDMAKQQIAASHRQNSVSFTVPLNPAVDVDKTIEVVAEGVIACGKVRRVRHAMDADSGRAVSEITLAISALGGVGIVHPETPTAAPAASDTGNLTVADGVTVARGYQDGSSYELKVTLDGIADAQRANSEITITSNYSAPIAEDVFLITT